MRSVCRDISPYWGLRDYNIPNQIGLEPTLQEFINRLRLVFSEVRRVLRSDGVFWLNVGTDTRVEIAVGAHPIKRIVRVQWKYDLIHPVD
jgi:hypothetical protein